MKLQLPNPGNGGRLGNQLFAIASTIGIALRNGYTPVIPENWQYRKDFNIPNEFFGPVHPTTNTVKEQRFEFDPIFPKGEVCGIVNSYLQSPKYWDGYAFQIREWLTPKGCVPANVDRTAIHYRRGDYLNNPNYVNLPMGYYLGAYSGGEIAAFSDDAAFLMLHHGQKQGTPIEDLRRMVESTKHIISNSSFSWWGAYLSGSDDVTYPSEWFAGALGERATTKDLFPANWIKGDVHNRFNARDVTFVIPFSYDHQDRLENLLLTTSFIASHFWSRVYIGEINTNKLSNYAGIKHFDFNGKMHRTRALNKMTKAATTPYVINWDTDVLCPPFQIAEMITMLRAGADICYPYNSPFNMVGKDYRGQLRNDLTLSPLAGKKFPTAGAIKMDDVSYGGAVGYNKEAFLKAGGENEMHISYSNEDHERWFRFNLLGLNVQRVEGQIYHIEHWRGENSSFRHKDGQANKLAWEREKKMSKEQLIEHIKTWTWVK